MAKLGPVGVSKLTVKYGGKPNRGHKPGRFRRGSGSIARKILQQLEKAELVRQTSKGVHKGRVITKKAAEMLNSAALLSRIVAAGKKSEKKWQSTNIQAERKGLTKKETRPNGPPFWVIAKAFGRGRRIHPSRITEVKRHWRRNKGKN